MDLFTILESLFRGVVYFFYNLVETIYVLLRHPRRGPARMYRRYKRKGRQQLGGLTLLFTLLFILFAGAAIADNRLDVGATVSAPLDMSGEFVWVSLLCALVSTVATDAAARLFLRFRYRRRSEKREIALTLFEYALAWPMVVLASWYVYVFFFPEIDEGLPNWLINLILLGAGFFSFLPAARILFIGRWRQGFKRWLRALARGVQIVLLLTFFAIALTVANQLRYGIYRAQADEPSLRVRHFRCMIGAARPYLDVVVDNPSDNAVTLDVRRGWALVVQPEPTSPRAQSRSYELAPEGGANAVPLQIPAGASQALRVYTVGRPAWQLGNVCRIFNREGQVPLDAFWSSPETGTEELRGVDWPEESGVSSVYP